MKKIFFLLYLTILMPAAWAKHVPQEDAQQIATTFYRLNNSSGIVNPQVLSATVKTFEDVTAFYIFRFTSGGFVLVAADDASIPILGYSFENYMPETIDNPATNRWLDNYGRQIADIIGNNLNNVETIKAWNEIQNGKSLAPGTDVGPLLTTTWDQGCYYNAHCPADAGGQCGHAVTGCVATAMAQIMKYHNFPPRGVGEHTYIAGNYGPQSADFGNTTYDWPAMANSVTSDNPAVATLMYHAGVSVEMGYSATSSGAMDNNIPAAMVDYFNYNPEIDIKYKENYPNIEDFKTLLRVDLDAHLPICYGGSSPNVGHEFVCDGYRMSDSTFHFNWGWSGYYDGYFTIGNLNPGGNTFNSGNSVVVNIKPYNPNLIVRITSPADKTVAAPGESIEIKARVVRGSASLLKIMIDSVEKISTEGDSISYTWNTSSADLGTHHVRAYAMNATDTVYYKILVNVNEWVSQVSGFPTPSRAVTFISAVDSNIVWASAWNANNLGGAPCSDFTRTTNGGHTWTPGVITDSDGLYTSMIFAIDSLKAYTAMYRLSGNKPMGIYVTSDGGVTWARQTSASYSNAASAPDVVHFFNINDGVCFGDVVSGEYEIYTTTNGGTLWTKVPGGNIPNPQSSEMGIVGYYSAVNDTIWCGTSRGRVYRSVDKGYHWTVSTAAAMSGKYVKPEFRNGSHGLLQDENSGAGVLCETFDGGLTWTRVNYTGPNYSGDIAYVPGTPNTWVRSGYLGGALGCAYSFDGGHAWTSFVGTAGSMFCQMDWVNNHCGWSGGVNTNATVGGIHKFIGYLAQNPVGIAPLPAAGQIELSVFPNPAHARAMVKTSGPILEISVCDMKGNIVPVVVKPLSAGLSTMDISRLKAGIYLVSVKSVAGISATRLLVN